MAVVVYLQPKENNNTIIIIHRQLLSTALWVGDRNEYRYIEIKERSESLPNGEEYKIGL